jgi:hypothetical protein
VLCNIVRLNNVPQDSSSRKEKDSVKTEQPKAWVQIPACKYVQQSVSSLTLGSAFYRNNGKLLAKNATN